MKYQAPSNLIYTFLIKIVHFFFFFFIYFHLYLVFDNALNNTIQNIRNDQYARFLQSSLYKEMLEDIKKNYEISCKKCGLEQQEGTNFCGECKEKTSVEYTIIDKEELKRSQNMYRPNFTNSPKIRGKEKLSFFNNVVSNLEKSQFFRQFLERENKRKKKKKNSTN